ncbi:ABC transporter, ATP-binding protein, partial [Opisthorchis viverrini]
MTNITDFYDAFSQFSSDFFSPSPRIASAGNRIINIFGFNISVSTLDFIGNLSVPVCGVPADQNDLGRLALELKSLPPSMTDGSGILTVEGASLNRQRRMASNSASESTTQSPVSDFCKTVYQFFLTDHIQSFVSRLGFFLFGYIYYYPSTPVTDEIMRRASYPWRLTDRFHTIVKHYLNHTGPALIRLIANNRPLAVSESLLKLCEVLQVTQPNFAAEFCPFASRLTSKLRNLPFILNSTTRLLEIVDQFLDCRNEFISLYPIQSEQTFKKILELHSSLSFPPGAGVNFLRVPQKTDMSDAEFFEIVLRQLESPNNFRVFDRYWTPRPRQNPLDGDVGFVSKGSLDIQELITGAVVDMVAKRPDRLERPADPQSLYNDELPGQEFKFFPTPCYVQKDFLNSFSRMLPQFMLFAWILTAMLTTKYIVEEKEQRLKEFTRIMGLSALIHWLGWFSITFLIMGTSALIIALMFKLGNIVPLANFFMLLLLSLSYMVAVIALTFLCSTFFTRANLGAIVTAMIYFILYLPTPLIFSNESAMTETIMFAASLSCQVAYSLGLFYFVRIETQGFGAQWQDFWKARFAEDVFSIGKCMLMLWVDAGIYLLLAWYVDNVYPGKYGLRRPFYFPFTRTYWVEGRTRTVLATDGDSIDSDIRDERYFEPDQTRNAVGVTVLNVTKKYAKMRKPALENLSIKFYADQITSLLGHNGAGKSTLISILTGMIPPSKGTAQVAGYDTQKQLREVHDHLGFCPQYNVLFDHLTVAEHFRFYGSVKGLSKLSIGKEIDMFLETLGFQDKRDCLSKTLSGGQKRKLSVAIAFIGDAPVIFLDEPTAGVDPFSRRSIWDLIIDLRRKRTIILTTHHMDEADVLGDRIAILSQGRLRCCGTSLFLKSNHGQGYYLILTRDRTEQTESTSTSSNVQAVLDFVGQFMSDIQLVSVTSTEIVLQLPSRYAYDGQFSAFFKTLETDYAKTNCNVCKELRVLGIISYGLSDTSLEEVFLELAEDPSFELAESEIKAETTVEACNQEEGPHSKSNYFSRRKSQINALRVSARLSKYTDDGKLPLPATRQSLLNRTHVYASLSSGLDELGIDSTQLQPNCGQQMKAMFLKRFHYFKRYKLGWAIEFLLPISLIILTMLVVDYFHVSVSNSPMSLNPWWMSPPQGAPLNVFYENQMYAKKDPNTTSGVMRTIRQVASIYESALTAAYGYTGTRCVPPNIHTFTPAKASSCSHHISPPNWNYAEQLSSVERQLARDSSYVKCSCTKGSQDCPENAVQPDHPPTVTLQTTDILYNLTAYNVTEYLLKTRDSFIYRRFGGLSFIVNPNPAARGELETILDPSRPLYMELGQLTPIDGNRPDPFWLQLADTVRLMLPPTHHLQIWFDNKGYVSAKGYLNMLQNVQLRLMAAKLKSTSFPPLSLESERSYGIDNVNYPIDLPQKVLASRSGRSLLLDVTLAVFTMLALSFIPASFITFLVSEKQSGSKHLQFLSGLKPFVYWTSIYIWDIINFSISATLCTLVFVAFRQDAFVGHDTAGTFILLILFYGLAILPIHYAFSFVIRSPSTALVVMAITNLLLGSVTVMTTFFLDTLSQDQPNLIPVNSALKNVFLIFPQYCFGRGLYDLAFRKFILKYQNSGFIDVTPYQNPLSWDGIGKKLFALGLTTLLLAPFVLVIEQRFFVGPMRTYFHRRYPNLSQKRLKKLRKRLAELDSEQEQLPADVLEEKERAHKFRQSNSMRPNPSVLATDLTKFFRRKKKPSVNRLSFAIHPAECFGLLGLNGAGKTTTFRMLTGSLSPTAGAAYVDGYHVINQMSQAQQSLGFCPQTDALLNTLTGRETLTLYARLRGVPEPKIPPVVAKLLNNMGLAPHADKVAGAYSGGNRRKLSTAIAILGSPRVIFLDEPTSGMDPVGKRFLWDQILRLTKAGKAVVLTSHSMEECEALCNRLGIMVNGQFRCLGSVQQLKNRYGNGYIAEVRLTDKPQADVDVRITLQNEFPAVTVNKSYNRCHEYQFSQGVQMSKLFTVLNKLRENEWIDQYSVRQTTLDHVFVNFARMQVEPPELSEGDGSISDVEEPDTETVSTSAEEYPLNVAILLLDFLRLGHEREDGRPTRNFNNMYQQVELLNLSLVRKTYKRTIYITLSSKSPVIDTDGNVFN